MIYSREAEEAVCNTEEKAVWKRKFALLPKCVSLDTTKRMKTFVWLDYYEVRLYWVEKKGWCREYRLPGAQTSWKVDANTYD
jgi:hypothetical protein